MYNDPFGGLKLVDGVITVPDGPGCGVEPVAVEARRAGAA
jgi:L-alanine-DL-glutamate epimerase-like enolase superfamily enzyme